MNKSEKLQIYVTAEALEQLQRAAKAEHLHLNDWARHVLLKEAESVGQTHTEK